MMKEQMHSTPWSPGCEQVKLRKTTDSVCLKVIKKVKRKLKEKNAYKTHSIEIIATNNQYSGAIALKKLRTLDFISS